MEALLFWSAAIFRNNERAILPDDMGKDRLCASSFQEVK